MVVRTQSPISASSRLSSFTICNSYVNWLNGKFTVSFSAFKSQLINGPLGVFVSLATVGDFASGSLSPVVKAKVGNKQQIAKL